MRLASISLVALALFAVSRTSFAADGNRLAYLDENDPYYVSRTFPKLVTPQWVGEEGVEAVVVLAIDDMRDPEKYEAYLRPILDRLKKIDGRAPVSIMTNKVDPNHPRLQQWLKEGLSLDAHTIDHPCPLLAGGDFAKAKSTYDRGIDLLNAIPGNRPVAFRMPCCDSLNTPSPRFWAEIFNKTTEQGRYLQIDTSVFNLITANDPDLPRDLVIDEQGHDRFRRYVPFPSFVNTIEDYPYPYVIGRLCWEFPCAAPSDWSAQHVQKPNNPRTVEDWKRVLDATVIKQGVMNLVFHPHGWIKAEQVAELVDYADTKYGKRIKFLTFPEALDRLNKHLLAGQPLRNAKGEDNGVRLLDVNNDGYMDVVIGNDLVQQTRVWSPRESRWDESEFPVRVADADFGVIRSDGMASLVVGGFVLMPGTYSFDGKKWAAEPESGTLISSELRLRDVDGDGRCEVIAAATQETPQMVFKWKGNDWERLPFSLPAGTMPVAENARDAGLRFVDIDEDGRLDVLFSNQDRYSLHLFTDMKEGWGKPVIAAKRDESNQAIPVIVRGDGTDNGAFFHSRHLWVQNEDTATLPNLVDRRSFNDLLRDAGQPGPKSPEASLRSIRVRPGFQVELVAAEPLVMDPVIFDWGPDGKLWVAEMADYPLGEDGKGKPGGRVRLLEDTDGDGKYDKSTVFLDGLAYPTGIFPWRNGVLVIAAPDLFYAEDTDGDGKADRRDVLFTGFYQGNPQHLANGLTYGLDNWLYGANGHSGGTVKSTKTGSSINIGGRDFRIRPDEGVIDVQSGPTQFGRARDDWGNWFGNENSNPMYVFALEDHYLRRNPHVPAPNVRVPVSEQPGTAPVYPISRTLERFNDFWALNRFTSANSAIVYRDDLFGPHFENNTFVSEPVHNLLHREVMRPAGLVFKSRRPDDEQTSEFLASTDNWFRPATLRTGPDGALWVADMYRHVIEHPEWIPPEWQRKLDLRAGHDKGRIYRVYPVGVKPRPIPRLDKLDTVGLVAALDSPNGWQRDTAQRLLIEQKDEAAVPLLEKLAAESQRPQARLHALCTLGGIDSLATHVLERALLDAHPGVRRHAVRLSEGRMESSPALAEAVLKRLDDEDPHVRLQLAYSLGTWNHHTTADALGRLLVRHGDEALFRAAILSSIHKGNIERIAHNGEALERRQLPRAALRDLLRATRASDDPRLLAKLLNNLGLPPGPLFNPGVRPVPPAVQAEPWQFEAMADVLGAGGGGNGSALLRAAEEQRQSKNSDYNPWGQHTILMVGELTSQARTAAFDRNGDEARRLAAIRYIAALPPEGRKFLGKDVDANQVAELLGGLLVPQEPHRVQAEAAAAIGRLANQNGPRLLLAGWRNHGPQLRAAVLDALLSRDNATGALLDAIEAKQVLPGEIDAERRQRLLRHKSAALRGRAERLLADVVQPDRAKVIEAFRPAVAMEGDPARGAELFAKLCATCHKLGDAGNAVGPDLAGLTDKSPENLLVQILDPNRAVEAQYTNYVVETADGRTLTGILTNETGSSVTLLGADGQAQPVVRSELKSLRSAGVSLMPEGLETGLQPQDLADLFAHVRGTDAPQPRKAFPGNKPEVVFPQAGAQGILRLTPANAEIYGPSIQLEQKYGNLGFWSSEQDRAAWTTQPARAGRYAVWLEYACDNSSAGNRYLLQAGNGRVTGQVEGTGNWDTYKRVKVGEVELDATRQRVTLRPAGKVNGALLDLKAIELVPLPNQ